MLRGTSNWQPEQLGRAQYLWMNSVADKVSTDEAEGRLSGAILHFTQAAGTDPVGVLRALTVEARNLSLADYTFFAAVHGNSSLTASAKPLIIAGTMPAGSDWALAQFFPPSIFSPTDMDPNAAAAESAQDNQSWLVLPLLSAEQTLYGHVVLGKAAANHFTPHCRQGIAALLAHAAIVLDCAKLIESKMSVSRNLTRSLAIRDNFLSIASHELRNPLNSLHLRLNILKREAGLLTAPEEEKERFADHVAKASAQVTRMAALLDRLLDISRIASGRIQLRLRQYDITLQLKQIVERSVTQSLPGQIQLSIPDSVTGSWDDLRIDQVITNLLANALKYGEGKPIELTLQDTGDSVTIAIADHGIGIAAEDHNRIFERFERADSDQSRSGYGLGLWISRQIVMAMGGSISVRSQPGQGTVFTVRLPRDSPGQLNS